MSGGQAASGVSFRSDLREMLDEFDFNQFQILMADQILPPIPVDEASAYYPVLPRESRLRIPDTARAGNGTYARDQWEYESATYATKEYGFEEPIDLTRAATVSSWIDEEEIASQLATQKLMLGRESRVAGKVFDSTTFTGATNTLAITNEWDDGANADPRGDIDTGAAYIKSKCGINRSNLTLILTSDVFEYAMTCTKVVNSTIYTEAVVGMPRARRLQFFADFLGIKNILLVEALYETTKVGQSTTALGQLWSNEYAMLALLNTNVKTWKQPGLGRQPAFRKVTDTYMIEQYTEPQSRRLIIRSLEYRGTTINTEYGFLFSNMKTTVGTGGI